jgi:NAD(P)-dependent dehydrogenase (short-subunit alcohol dehydrogenase family)
MSAEADVKLDNFKGIFSLDGKVAVVTGGSRGLGLHAASGYVHQDLVSVHAPGLHVLASSKPAARKSSSHPARPLRAKKHALR